MSETKTKLLFNPLIVFISLSVIVLLVFQNAFFAQLLNWDDTFYVEQNQLIHNFTFQKLWQLFNPNTYVMGNYHPITMLSYVFDQYLPFPEVQAHHISNLALHIFNAFLVFFLATFFIQRKEICFFVAVLFALHPTRVETVMWISDRKDLLVTFFSLASIISYVNYALKNKNSYLIWAVLFFALACLSKATAVFLPLLFIAYHVFIFKQVGSKWKIVVAFSLLFIIALLTGFLAIKAQQTNLASGAVNQTVSFSSFLYAGYALIQYFIHFFAPLHLSAFYPYSASASYLYLAGWSVVMLGVCVLILFKKREWIFFIFFFLVSILLTLQIIPIGNAITADRYSYFPYIGLFLLLGKMADTYYHFVIRIAFLSTALVLGFMSYKYSFVWMNSKNLWTHVIHEYPNLSFAYINRGEAFERENKLTLALVDYEQSIFLDSAKMAYLRKAAILEREGERVKAIRTLNECIDRHSDYEVAYNNRAILLKKELVFNKAINDLTKAIELSPNYYEAYVNRANIYYGLGKFEEAENDCKKALEINPKFAEAYNTWGTIYALQKDYEKAKWYYEKGLQIDKTNAAILRNIELIKQSTLGKSALD